MRISDWSSDVCSSDLEAAAPRLVDEIAPRLEKQLGGPLTEQARSRLAAGMDGLKARGKTLVELAENAAFYVSERPLPLDRKAGQIPAHAARDRPGPRARRAGHHHPRPSHPPPAHPPHHHHPPHP